MTLLQDVLEHARQLPAVHEGFPFGHDSLVLKVAGKIFLLASRRAVPVRTNLKHDASATYRCGGVIPATRFPATT